MYITDIMFVPQFYQEANEADVWMNDRAGLAASHDYGRDEDAAQKLLKKHKVCHKECFSNKLFNPLYSPVSSRRGGGLQYCRG